MIKTKRSYWIGTITIVLISLFIVTSCNQPSNNITTPKQKTTTLNKVSSDIQKVFQIQDRNTNGLLRKKGVIGTATIKLSDGSFAIKILTNKNGMSKVLPKNIEGVPVVVSNVGDVYAQDVFTGKYRPVPSGVSGGNFNDYRYFPGAGGGACVGGTIGCVVEKNGMKYFLSNNHVFARKNRASIGEGIVQPGLIDTDPVCSQNPGDVVANLTDFQVIKWQPLRNTNYIDAAIAKVKPGVDVSCAMVSGYTPSSSPVTATLGMKVKKTGRTTGLTHGTVTAVNVTVVVNYTPDGGYARFDDQVEFSNMSAGGDSGSLIVTDDSNNNPVALLYAGSTETTIGNPIQMVLDHFGVTICSN